MARAELLMETVAPEPGGNSASCWSIPKHGGMRVSAHLYGDRATLAEVTAGETLTQLAAVASLPGVVGPVCALPQVQPGCGFPAGAVAAFDARAGGVIVPGGIGYDINCGVRLLSAAVDASELRPRLATLMDDLLRGALYAPMRLSAPELASVLGHGASWAVAHGCGIPADVDPLDWRGTMPGADPRLVSERALVRGGGQLGTLGSGSHFVEIGYVERILDPAAADALSLRAGQVTAMLHSGSRGLGYQVSADGVELMQRAVERYRIQLPDRQLACAPLASDEARRFLGALAAAANYAFANRQVLTHRVREAVARALAVPVDALGLSVLCDVPHNLAAFENHVVEGRALSLCVHRRGAARGLPAGHPDLPNALRGLGQPVVLPGDMGRYSLLLLPEPGIAATFNSLPHGAGRRLGRAAAHGRPSSHPWPHELADAGIEVRSAAPEIVEECTPDAYHELEAILEVLSAARLARPVARLRPLGVLRG